MATEFTVKRVGLRDWGSGPAVQVCRAGIGVSGLGLIGLVGFRVYRV